MPDPSVVLEPADPDDSFDVGSTPTPTTTIAPATTPAPTTTVAPTVGGRLIEWPPPPDSDLVDLDDSSEMIPRFLPTSALPVGDTLVRGIGGGGTAGTPTYTQVFVDPDRDAVLTLQTQPSGVESTPEDLREDVTIPGWENAFLTEGSLRLVASDSSGFVRLSGTGIDADEAMSIVETMRVRTDGTPGWELFAEGFAEINGAWDGSAGQRIVTWFDGDSVVAQMVSSPANTNLVAMALGTSVDRVDVDGAVGWLNAVDARRSVVWSPDGGATTVVLGVVDDRIDPLEVARSVSEVDAEAYESQTVTEFPPGVGDGCDAGLFC